MWQKFDSYKRHYSNYAMVKKYAYGAMGTVGGLLSTCFAEIIRK